MRRFEMSPWPLRWNVRIGYPATPSSKVPSSAWWNMVFSQTKLPEKDHSMNNLIITRGFQQKCHGFYMVLWHSTYLLTNNAMESRRKKSASLKFWGLDDLWSWSSWELPWSPIDSKKITILRKVKRCVWGGGAPKNPMKWWKLYQSGCPKRKIPTEQTSGSLVIGWGRGAIQTTSRLKLLTARSICCPAML